MVNSTIRLTNATIKALLSTSKTEDRNRVIDNFTPDLKRIISIVGKTSHPETYLGKVVEILILRMPSFDLDKLPFEAYLKYTVQEALTDCYVEDATIYQPRERQQLGARARKWASNYYAQNGFEPTLEEIAEGIGAKTDLLSEVWDLQHIDELDTPLSDDEDSCTRGDMLYIADETSSFDRDGFRTDLRRCVNLLVKEGKVTRKAADTFLAYYSPEEDYMDPQYESLAERLGYNSVPALKYPILAVLNQLKADRRFKWLFNAYVA